MKLSCKPNPYERDSTGSIPDFEKTWVCFTLTVKKAEDENTARDALEFIEWYLNYEVDIPCVLQSYPKYENGIYSDILTFDHDMDMTKNERVKELTIALHEAKTVLYEKLATAIPPHILVATRKDV